MRQLLFSLLFLVSPLFGSAAEESCFSRIQNSLRSISAVNDNLCEETLKSQQCQTLFSDMRARGEKTEDKALQCKKQNVVFKSIEENFDFRIGCALGGWNFVQNTFVGIGTLLGESAAQFMLDREQTAAENAACDADPQLKKSLYSNYNNEVPQLLKIAVPSDETFARMNCATAKSNLKDHRYTTSTEVGQRLYAKALANDASRTEAEKEYIEWGKKKNSRQSIDLIALAKNKLREMGVQLECYNTRARAAMMCEAIAEVATLVGGPAAAGLKAAKVKNIFKIAGLARKEVKIGSEFKTGLIPKSDPQTAKLFTEKFGKDSGVFYRGIRVPKGGQVDEYYVRPDGLGSMVSTRADDAFHYGKSPAGLKTSKLNADDDIVVMSYELKPYHIQEDPYGTLEHVFIDPNVNLKSTALKYKEIRIPAKDFDNPELMKKYMQQLKGEK
ncbi:hypothetical protein CIK05_14820 [Bdellovibrio sp. qaytius]|nr:hypothetical protein CIK05_14820 [Bdellovibrio sp. qaytius]